MNKMTSERVEQAIDEMVEFLKSKRRDFQTCCGKRCIDITIECFKIEREELEIDQLQSEINNYYSTQPWYKNLAINLGIKDVPLRIEACQELLSYRKKH